MYLFTSWLFNEKLPVLLKSSHYYNYCLMSSQERGTLVLVCRLHIRLNLQMMSDRGNVRTGVRFAERLEATRNLVKSC